MHRRNLFREIGHGNESERIFLEKLSQDEKIDPATGQAHYYKSDVVKNMVTYSIKIPKSPEMDKILGNVEFVKVVMPRAKDNYIVIKPYE